MNDHTSEWWQNASLHERLDDEWAEEFGNRGIPYPHKHFYDWIYWTGIRVTAQALEDAEAVQQATVRLKEMGPLVPEDWAVLMAEQREDARATAASLASLLESDYTNREDEVIGGMAEPYARAKRLLAYLEGKQE